MLVFVTFCWFSLAFGFPDRFHTESLLHNLTFDNAEGGKWRQGWDVQYKEKLPLQVFLVPFSHNDPGWVKTFDEYFTAQTTHILTTVVNGLSSDPRRRFMWTEMSYLQRWWDTQPPDMQRKLRSVVESGQLEITTGGWVMNDEATVHYESTLVQLLEGHSWLRRTLDHRPSKGWSIDPFGHSPNQAYIYALSGFDAMVCHRFHYRVKKHLAQQRALEFFWRQTWQDDKQHTDMLTHVFPFYSYDIPHTCGPDPSICSQFDFARTHTQWGGTVVPINDNNVAQRAALLLDQYRKKAELYRTRVLLVSLGDDFRYQTPQEFEAQFTQHQRIHDFINSDAASNAHVQFGTLREYFAAIAAAHPAAYVPHLTPFDAHASPLPDPHPNWKQQVEGEQQQQPAASAAAAGGASSVVLPLVQGDFFAYSDINTDYWTGYFTSRAYYKLLGRLVQAEVRAAEIACSWLAAMGSGTQAISGTSSLLSKAPELLEAARRSIALFQHHDGMTGTAKTHVMDDYAARLRLAAASAQELTASAVAALLSVPGRPPPPLHRLLPQLPSSEPANAAANVLTAGSQPQPLVFFNPLAEPRSELVEVRVSAADVTVRDAAGTELPSQLNPVWSSPGVVSESEFSLWFEVSVPPLGMTTYWLQQAEQQQASTAAVPSVASVTLFGSGAAAAVGRLQQHKPFDVKLGSSAERQEIANAVLRVELDPATGHVRRMVTDQVDMPLEEQWVRYADQGGAYLFQPVDAGVPLQPDTSNAVWALVRGPLLDEARPVPLRSVGDRVTRLSSTHDERADAALSVEATVELLGDDNSDVAARWAADMPKAGGEFVTDLNGLSFQRRHFRSDRPLQANFYPACSHVYVEEPRGDRRARFSVHTRQPFSVSSPHSGSIDLLLDRRLVNDDRRGVEQGVQDNHATRVRLFLTMELLESAATSLPQPFPTLASHAVSRQLNYPLLGFVSTEGIAADSIQPAFRPMKPFSPELHVVSLRPSMLANGSSTTSTLHVLRHLCDDRPSEALPLTFDSIFAGDCVSVSAFQEHSLTLIQDRGSRQQPQHSVAMYPMDLRAFSVQLDLEKVSACFVLQNAAKSASVGQQPRRVRDTPPPPAAIGPAEAQWFAGEGQKPKGQSVQPAAVGDAPLRLRGGISGVIKWVLIITSLLGACGLGVYRRQKQRNRKIVNTAILLLLSFSVVNFFATQLLLSSLVFDPN
eukprot:TRINITY_DN1017_c0_g1_i8.p1 TRINITY_DN1017_c0_g1~~TRINITY_DN1017_c0_g1_i8.p1  ORF type:complete len:1205 (+),score=332.33 TRINITY_DN1017_c0_g1_i8:2469-6083(+)